MRFTGDTNVLVSATFWCGDSDKLLESVERKENILVLSKDILEEFAGVLEYEEIQRKIWNKKLEMRRTVDKIASIAEIVDPAFQLDVIKDDPDDNRILECAKAGNADYIVTNDKHLLSLKEFEGIKIVTPAEMLKVLK